jgi:hypothetical protein
MRVQHQRGIDQAPAVAGEVPNELTVTLDHLLEAGLAPQHGACQQAF